MKANETFISFDKILFNQLQSVCRKVCFQCVNSSVAKSEGSWASDL